ncbi:MAG: HlyC/CorC family transporter [Gammaproteobacteria bacterium]|nr:HlyC/CorC family transporter [Gammaproteobacteria bacterium]
MSRGGEWLLDTLFRHRSLYPQRPIGGPPFLNDDVPLGLLFGLLIVLLALSAFFSSTETALMSLNRYRLRHRARSGQRAARLAEALLKRPDRLIGLILLGNNAVNLGAAALVTVIALRTGGEGAIFVATLMLTFVVLIFCEVAPKTIAALHPSKVALPGAMIYYPLLKVAYPVVWLINLFTNGLLRLLGVRPELASSHSLSADELRTVVAEAGVMVPRRHRRMLLSILDLDSVTVDDVMVPRQEIVGIDLERDWKENLNVIQNSGFNRLPVYRDGIDDIIGVVRPRQFLCELASGTLNQERLMKYLREPYFVPEGTPLNRQLMNFQQHRRRSAFVVDEYGDVQGLITTEDIVREIVGDLDPAAKASDIGITREGEHTYVVDASTNIRQLNRLMNWQLPTDGPKTLNGLIIERLETIPDPGTNLTVEEYPLEILSTTEHGIRQVRVSAPDVEEESPPLRVAHN